MVMAIHQAAPPSHPPDTSTTTTQSTSGESLTIEAGLTEAQQFPNTLGKLFRYFAMKSCYSI